MVDFLVNEIVERICISKSANNELPNDEQCSPIIPNYKSISSLVEVQFSKGYVIIFESSRGTK